MNPTKPVSRGGLTAALLATIFYATAPFGAGASSPGPPRLKPLRAGQEVILFEAGRQDTAAIQNYTARWKPGSDVTPVATTVTKGDETWVQFAFRGTNGMACSTLFFEPMPPAGAGRSYRGLCLTIDCDRDDYPHLGVNAVFSDNSQLSHDLALDRGKHAYAIETGFRREKRPPDWSTLSHVMITLTVARQSPDLVYRLGKMTMREIKREAGEDPSAEVPDRFEEMLLSPRPKELVLKEGVFLARKDWPLFLDASATDRTRRTAELFAERYRQHTGKRPEIRAGEAMPARGILLRVADHGQGAARAQGHALRVAPDRVIITGNDEAGLYYGTVTFFQLVKHALKKNEPDLPVPCVEVTDWPDLLNRLIRLEHPHTFRNYPVRENRGIDYLIDWADRFVAGNKFTTLYIDVSANVRYERRPEFNGTEKIYSLADLRRFGAFCRDHFIDLCPAWQIGGHANWWLTIGYHPELREKGWPSQADVTHPDHDAIVRDCMQDVIDALRPKYLSPKSDEWWHERKEGETPDPLLHGKTRASAYRDFHVSLNAWLKGQGITMMMFEDMLSPYHNGKRFDTYRAIDGFPRDVILTHWSGGNVDREIKYFSDRGFRIWPNATGMFTLGEDSRRRVIGFGKGMYSFGDDRSKLLDEYSPLWSLSNLIRVGDYAWNIGRGEEKDPGRLVAIQHLLAIRGNERAGVRVRPIDIGAALGNRFDRSPTKAESPGGVSMGKSGADVFEREVGFIPMRLAEGGRRCMTLRKGDAAVPLAIRGRYSSLIFLHAAAINNPDDKSVAGVRVRDWMYGWPCGGYTVHYADGATAVLPIRITDNIKRWDTAAATRASLNCRYTWTLAVAGHAPAHLFQWEWINPAPEKEIVRVVAKHDNILDVSLMLFAVSGREIADPGPR